MNFAFATPEIYNLSGKIGYGNISFKVDGLQASKVTVTESNPDECEIPFTGYI